MRFQWVGMNAERHLRRAKPQAYRLVRDPVGGLPRRLQIVAVLREAVVADFCCEGGAGWWGKNFWLPIGGAE